MTDISSIDDILATASSPQNVPSTPESSPGLATPEDFEPSDPHYSELEPEEPPTETSAPEATESPKIDSPEPELDDYGNEKPKARTFTEEEVKEKINNAIRDRLARGRHSDFTQPQEPIKQAEKAFEFDTTSNEGWEVQLENFIDQTIAKREHKNLQKQVKMKEQQANDELAFKILSGRDRFNDYDQTVSSQPITDAMTYSLRGVQDPAAFIYKASKDYSGELKRISQLPDPYAQVLEMGKLEERMRQSKSGTKAPRPLARTPEDVVVKREPEKKEDTIEELIAKSDAKRRAALGIKRGR